MEKNKTSESDKPTDSDMISMEGLEELVAESNRKARIQSKIAKLTSILEDLEKSAILATPAREVAMNQQKINIQAQIAELSTQLDMSFDMSR